MNFLDNKKENFKSLMILKKNKLIIIKAIIIVVMLGKLITSFIFSRIYIIRLFGVKLIPIEEITPYKVKYFLQDNSSWSDIKLGNSKYTLGSHGCLVSVVASSVSFFGYETNPLKLNNLLTQNACYDEHGNIIWYKINEAIPTLDYDYKRIFDSSQITSDLKNGYLPIVKV